MSSRLSTRLSIRWVPGEPSEPTDTLVISVGGWYVDLRITKADGTIDWAMAGERIILSQEPLTCKWTHWIDSRGYTEPDIGSFQPIDSPNGTDSVETGSMLDPETGLDTPYEEVWRSLPASFADSFGTAWILRSMDKKNFLGRVGGDFIALKGGDEDPVGEKGFCARRESWDGEKGCWAVRYEAGDSKHFHGLPSLTALEGKGVEVKEPEWAQSGKEGEMVNFFGEQYVLCALEKAA